MVAGVPKKKLYSGRFWFILQNKNIRGKGLMPAN